MPGGARNTDAVRARRREDVLRRLLVAVEELCNSGISYPEIRIDELLRTAEVNRSTFYTYFDDKNDLLRELAHRVLSGMIDSAVEHWYTAPAPASKDDLHRVLGDVISSYQPHQAIMTAMADAATGSSELARSFDLLMDRSTAALAAYIRRGQAEGFVCATVDPEPTGALLAWMAEGGFRALLATDQPEGIDAIHRGLTDIYWRGLRMRAI